MTEFHGESPTCWAIGPRDTFGTAGNPPVLPLGFRIENGVLTTDLVLVGWTVKIMWTEKLLHGF